MGSSHSDRGTASSRLLQRALAAAAQGFFVFPLAPKGKVPAQRGWQEQATHDPERICAWFRERAHNIGIATGPSWLLVIDLDDAHGQQAPDRWAGARHGRDVLARLAADAGEPVPTDTFSVATPSVIPGRLAACLLCLFRAVLVPNLVVASVLSLGVLRRDGTAASVFGWAPDLHRRSGVPVSRSLRRER